MAIKFIKFLGDNIKGLNQCTKMFFATFFMQSLHIQSLLVIKKLLSVSETDRRDYAKKTTIINKDSPIQEKAVISIRQWVSLSSDCVLCTTLQVKLAHMQNMSCNIKFTTNFPKAAFVIS